MLNIELFVVTGRKGDQRYEVIIDPTFSQPEKIKQKIQLAFPRWLEKD
jgi:hypothetical protein